MPRLGAFLLGAKATGRRIWARASASANYGETARARQGAQLRAALQRHAVRAVELASPAGAASTSRAELTSELARVIDSAYALAAERGVPRGEVEARLAPLVQPRGVFLRVSRLRSTIARAGTERFLQPRVVVSRFVTRARPAAQLVRANLPMVMHPSTRADVAAWAASLATQFVVERVLWPYLLKMSKHDHRLSPRAQLALELGRAAVPVGLRLLARNPR